MTQLAGPLVYQGASDLRQGRNQPMENEMKLSELEGLISHAARVGAVNLEAISSEEMIRFARKWSSHFRAAVDGLDDSLVWEGVKKAKERGPRVFRSGCGLWLTDKEWNEGR